MSEKDNASSPGRRRFLRIASLGPVAGAALLAAGRQGASAAEVDMATGSGYRETPHVKKAYELSRF